MTSVTKHALKDGTGTADLKTGKIHLSSKRFVAVIINHFSLLKMHAFFLT